MSIRIVIVQGGWIYVGRYAIEAGEAVIRDGYTLRRWGTAEGAHRGLGRIAESGPTTETELDRITETRVPYHALISTMLCTAPQWEGLCTPSR